MSVEVKNLTVNKCPCWHAWEHYSLLPIILPPARPRTRLLTSNQKRKQTPPFSGGLVSFFHWSGFGTKSDSCANTGSQTTMLPYTVEALQPLGGLVHGLDLLPKPSPDTLAMLDHELARRGVLIFANISLPGTLLSTVSEYFGSGQVVARHAVHDSAVHENILRVSNDPRQGIVGVGPQWHSDGFFERQIFSHVLFHAQRMPSTGGGGTSFADLAAAYDALPPRVQDAWSRLATVNAYSGAVHPLVTRHPRTGRRQLFIHLGMVGAVLRWPARSRNAHTLPDACAEALRSRQVDFGRLHAMDVRAAPSRACGHELLTEAEVRTLLRAVNEVLSRPAHSLTWTYSARYEDFGGESRRCESLSESSSHDEEDSSGDLVVVDNIAVAHRATSKAHDASAGVRVLHRTTVDGTWAADPPAESLLPPFVYVWGANPFDDGGLWSGADRYGVGLRWNASLAFRN